MHDVGGTLDRLKSAPKHTDFIVCDIESKDGDSQLAGFTRPFMTGVYTGATFHPFYDKPEARAEYPWDQAFYMPGGNVDRAMRFMLSKRFRGLNIYAHNAGRFDYLFFLPWLMHVGVDLGYRFTIIPVSSAIQILDVRRGTDKRNKWRFLDSVRLIPTRLDKAAKSFGLSGKVQHDLNIPEHDRASWNIYNGEDCRQLYMVMDKFHKYVETDLRGEVGVTAPSTAMKIFRRNHLKKSIPRSVDTHEFVRSGYFGGRVECFRKECEGLRYYDINSSYPASMLEDMPVGEGFWWDGEPSALVKESYIGFVECDVWVPTDLHIPPLPVRKGKLIFPTGRLSGIWEWGELQMALSVGCEIRKWKRSVWYEKGKLFDTYVKEIYWLRDKSNPEYKEGLAAIAKIMLNSLYGKFGMRTERKKLYLWDDPELPEGAIPTTGSPDSLLWMATEEADASYVLPQISARVTALSRVRLYQGMMQAIAAGGEVAYTDTDSVLTTAELATTTALGGWKDEYPEYSGRIAGRFVSPKVYILTVPNSDFEAFPFERDTVWESVRAKGLEDRSRKSIEFLEGGGTVLQKRLEKVGTLARGGFNSGPRIRMVPRRLLGGDPKRVEMKDGSTKPIELHMWDDLQTALGER